MRENIDDIIDFLGLTGAQAVELKYKLMNMAADLTFLLGKLREVDQEQGEEQYKGLINSLLDLINHYGEK